jgi:glucose-1-phosphate adenylyltransferase
MGNDYYQSLNDISEESQTKLLGIGKECYVKNSIVDKNVKIGNRVSIIGDDSLEDAETEEYCIRDGIVIIKKGANIPDDSIIGLPKPASAK